MSNDSQFDKRFATPSQKLIVGVSSFTLKTISGNIEIRRVRRIERSTKEAIHRRRRSTLLRRGAEVFEREERWLRGQPSDDFFIHFHQTPSSTDGFIINFHEREI